MSRSSAPLGPPNMARPMAAAESRLRVVFLTHYFPPEVGAPQTRLYELARRLLDAGVDVTVVTGFPNYPTGVIPEPYRGKGFMVDDVDGIRVLRCWVYAARNRGFLRRILNHLSFSFSSLRAVRKVGRTDVLFVQSPPLFVGLAALMYRRLKRAPFIFNVSDIWPQSAVEMGALRNGAAIRLAEMLELHIYRRASRITVPTQGIFEKLQSRGIPREKLVLLTNGTDTDTYRPSTRDADLAQRLGLDGRKVFLYAGTHGMAQGLDVILEAARLTKDSDILYVLVGEGADKEMLVDKAQRLHIANVKFLPNQPRSTMPGLLNLAYASIIPLRRLELFKAALPSKIFESMAVARPVVGPLWGEAAELVRTSGCGIVVEPEDPAALQQAVERLASDPELARQLGQHGRDYVVEHYDRKQIAGRLAELLRETAARV